MPYSNKHVVYTILLCVTKLVDSGYFWVSIALGKIVREVTAIMTVLKTGTTKRRPILTPRAR